MQTNGPFSDKMPRKLVYCSPSVIRKIFIYKEDLAFDTSEKFIFSRSSAIPPVMSGIKF